MPGRNSYDTMELYFGCTCKITVHGTAKIIEIAKIITPPIDSRISETITLPAPRPARRDPPPDGSRGRPRWAGGPRAQDREKPRRVIFSADRRRVARLAGRHRAGTWVPCLSFIGRSDGTTTQVELPWCFKIQNTLRVGLYGGLHSIPKQVSGVGLGPYKHAK